METLNPLLASLLCIDVKDSCKLDTKRNISDLQKAQTLKSWTCRSLQLLGAISPIAFGAWKLPCNGRLNCNLKKSPQANSFLHFFILYLFQTLHIRFHLNDKRHFHRHWFCLHGTCMNHYTDIPLPGSEYCSLQTLRAKLQQGRRCQAVASPDSPKASRFEQGFSHKVL